MKRLCIALAGGGARGAAHTGVLRVLEKHHIPIHCIAGTSSGAIVGSFHAAGLGPDRQLQFAQRLRWRSLRMIGIPKMGFFHSGELERFLTEHLGDLHFDELKIPLRVVATAFRTARPVVFKVGGVDIRKVTILAVAVAVVALGLLAVLLGKTTIGLHMRAASADFRTARPVVFRAGRVAPAVAASAAIPIVFSPVRLGEMVLVDGGLTNNLPSDLAREMGADIVLGVSVLSVFDEKRRYDTFFDIALGTMDLMSKVSTETGAHGCDICLSPLVGPRSPSDLARAPSMVAEGEAAMLRALPRLRELLELA